MSATNRGSLRLPRDAYYTPEWAVRIFLDRYLPGMEEPIAIMDPCVGYGAMPLALLSYFDDWEMNENLTKLYFTDIDLDSQLYTHDRLQERGFTRYEFSGTPDDDYLLNDFTPEVDLTIMNPPYKIALPFIQKALTHSKAVAALLRVGFLEARKRTPWLMENMPDVYLLNKRPKFIEETIDKTNGEPRKVDTDATAYAWMVWTRDMPQEIGVIEILDASDESSL